MVKEFGGFDLKIFELSMAVEEVFSPKAADTYYITQSSHHYVFFRICWPSIYPIGDGEVDVDVTHV